MKRENKKLGSWSNWSEPLDQASPEGNSTPRPESHYIYERFLLKVNFSSFFLVCNIVFQTESTVKYTMVSKESNILLGRTKKISKSN